MWGWLWLGVVGRRARSAGMCGRLGWTATGCGGAEGTSRLGYMLAAATEPDRAIPTRGLHLAGRDRAGHYGSVADAMIETHAANCFAFHSFNAPPRLASPCISDSPFDRPGAPCASGFDGKRR